MGNATRLHQLLMNLSGNAMKAMRSEGKLRLYIGQRVLGHSIETATGTIGPGAFAQIIVSDSGVGMSEATVKRIFEPFFTSREGGYGETGGNKSHGLGLAIVQSIVTEHKGAVVVRSTVGEGTEFEILIPTEIVTTEAVPNDEQEMIGQGQVIMVVDDESAIVSVLEETLASIGFEPIGFANAEQALAAFNKSPDRFDLVISDEVMPGLTGTEMIARMKELQPKLRTIVASAYGGLGFETRAVSAGVDRVLRKPYQRTELLAVISQLLDL
jgi:CheY-like chemotaxis protein